MGAWQTLTACAHPIVFISFTHNGGSGVLPFPFNKKTIFNLEHELQNGVLCLFFSGGLSKLGFKKKLVMGTLK